jgi:hypothetical protein
MKYNNTFWKFIWGLLATVAIFLAIFLSSGCGFEFSKSKKQTYVDSTNVSKKISQTADSSAGGAVKTDKTKITQNEEWWRIIQEWNARDTGSKTVINNNTYPQQPTRLIFEGGTSSRQEQRNITDSSFYMNIIKMLAIQFDSSNKRFEAIEKNKHSETKGVGITLLLVAVGVALIVIIVSKGYIGKYSIIKK